MSPDDKTLIALGLIVKPRGLSGEVVVRPYNEFSTSIRADLPVVISCRGEKFPAKIECVKKNNSKVWVKLEGIDDRDQAEDLRNSEILSEFRNLPEKQDGEFYVFDLVGLNVIDADNKIFGKVKEVLNFPANDVLVVEYDEGEILVPFVKVTVNEINIDEGNVKIGRIREFLV